MQVCEIYRGCRITFVEDVFDKNNRIKVKKGATGTLMSNNADDEYQVSVKVDGRHYPCHYVPIIAIQQAP